MALLSDELSLWEIAFRWESLDPDRFWLRLPLSVRDRFRTLMDAILRGHLDCSTLFLHKYHPDTCNGFPPEFFIRHHIDDVHACTEGRSFNRKLLRWAQIDRWAMRQWCERQGVPLPEFWFPPGWKLEYEWPDEDGEAETDDEIVPAVDAPAQSSESEPPIRNTQLQRIRMACQRIALYIWSKEPGLDIKAVAGRKEIQEWGGGAAYEFETVCAWLGEVDPRHPSKKRGRRRKNNSPPADDGPVATD